MVAFARTQGAAPPCFTIRFPSAAAAGSIVVGDDAQHVAQLASLWRLRVTHVDVSQRALLDDVDALVASQDRIVAWEQELSQRALARVASASVKAVLVGDAADETHFGYSFLLDAAVCASAFSLVARFGFSQRCSLLQPRLRRIVVDDVARMNDATAAADVFASRIAVTQSVLRRWLPRLLHNGDIHTMAFGVEARVPFSDPRVLSLAARVSAHDGYVDDDAPPEKAFLRRAVAPFLPPSVVARRKSALPRDDTMGPLWRARLRDELAHPGQVERLSSWLDVDALRTFADRDDVIDDTTRATLFSLVCFSGFVRRFACGQ
jgi:asparagine synthase (glutamine-hydrolysing)